MPNLKELKNKQTTLRSTQKITSAMKLVASSKYHRSSKDFARHQRGFIEFQNTMSRLVSHEDLVHHPWIEHGHTPPQPSHLVIVITSSRGLCGGFNNTLLRHLQGFVDKHQQKNHRFFFLCVGTKGYDFLRSTYPSLAIAHAPYEKKGGQHSPFYAQSLAGHVMAWLAKGLFHTSSLCYHQFHSILSQQPLIETFFPFNCKPHPQGSLWQQRLYRYEPSPLDLFEALTPCFMASYLYHSLLSSFVSEQATRMTAMDNATRNTKDMIEALEITYNRTRQAYITKELVEIISGAQAL